MNDLLRYLNDYGVVNILLVLFAGFAVGLLIQAILLRGNSTHSAGLEVTFSMPLKPRNTSSAQDTLADADIFCYQLNSKLQVKLRVGNQDLYTSNSPRGLSEDVAFKFAVIIGLCTRNFFKCLKCLFLYRTTSRQHFYFARYLSRILETSVN